MTTAPKPAYRALIGFDYEPKGKPPQRFDAGDPVGGLPVGVTRDLLNAEPPVIEARDVVAAKVAA